jgi:hypothetical protein
MDYLTSQVVIEIYRMRWCAIDLERRCGYTIQRGTRRGIPLVRTLTARLQRSGREL